MGSSPMSYTRSKRAPRPMPHPASVLDSIGNTPIVPLRGIVSRGSARILVKLEWANPTGSMKDRMAKAMTRRLAKEEGLFAGASSGANVVAALKVAERLGPYATAVTLMVDSGLRTLSTDLYP